MKRKISTTLAATLIASQVQTIAYAEDINNIDLANVINEESKDNKDSSEGIKDGNKKEVKEEKQEVLMISDNYEAKGKLELDMNFALPLKYVNSTETNLVVSLKSGEKVLGTVKLGNDTTDGKLDSDVTYKLEALDGKRAPLKDGATELEYYHLTFGKLPLGTYSLEVSGEGYETANINDIEIQSSSKRVLLGTSDKTMVIDDKGTEDISDDIKEVYPGVLLVGDVNNDNLVNEADYNEVKGLIKTGKSSNKADLNRDGKVDITDLTYVHQNIGKEKKTVIIEETDPIINPDKVDLKVTDGQVEGDIKNILKDNGSSVTIKPEEGKDLNAENPISIPINLAGTSTYSTGSKVNVESIVIKAPSETAPGTGSIVIPGAGENGQDLVKSFGEKNITRGKYRTVNGESLDEITIDLGKQVAVSQITIKVTGGRNNKNLAEISKVDFINNVYEEVPAPKMNIPVINNFKSATAVGNEHMEFSWDHQTNVTGYEIKVEPINDNGSVGSPSYYKTSENSLKIEKVEPYRTYRISIQSLNGEWKSGYKNQQDGYDPKASGDTNLKNNTNDMDGKPDNVDSNYKPHGWDSISGVLSDKATDGVEKPNFYGADSIVELQVIPETAPEGPEGITITGVYKGLNVSWKSHKKAKDYDLYYRKVGTNEWIKANDPDKSYVDSNPNNNIPDGVADLSPEEKKDHNELIRGTSYSIRDLDDQATYEIMMTATNHHGTGGLSQTYIGSTAKLIEPKIPGYKLINTDGKSHIESVELVQNNSRYEGDPNDMVDNDYSTSWQLKDWDGGVEYGNRMPVFTFDKEYTFDTIRLSARMDGAELPRQGMLRIFNEEGKEIQRVNKGDISVKHMTDEFGGRYAELKLKEPVTAKKIELNLSTWNRLISISEIKFYEYDDLEDQVNALFKGDLMLELNDDVTQERINELVKRANTMDTLSMEYHPNREQIIADLERAQQLYDDKALSEKILTLDGRIRNAGNTIGQSNDWQSLGVAVKPGDKINIYIGSERKDTQFDLAITQHYAESGTAVQTYHQKLKVGRNEIVIPESAFKMDYEKGGNLYIRFASGWKEEQIVQVRVSGGTEIPHLNLNNLIEDKSKEKEVKSLIRDYIKQLETYVKELPAKYPTEVSPEDKINNIYKYDPETSILNSTEIEGDRITLSLAADQVLKGIKSGIENDENAQVERLYNTLLAWEQLMKVSYAQQGLIESGIDFNNNGSIDNEKQDILGGISEVDFFNKNRAPLNRINIKYQRMFTGAFMYASGHHVGIGYGSIPDMMSGVPYKFDESGKLVNAKEGNLFGWGINHEVGHVHDVNGLTYVETTNNILALITQTFNDIDSSRIEGAYDKVYDKVTSGSEGLASDNFVRLAMFWQLHLAYDNDYTYNMLENNTDKNLENDTFYAKLYRATREKGIAPKEVGHDQTAQTFIIRSSDAVGKDLREFFKRWGLVASPKTNEYLDNKGYEEEKDAIFYLNDDARRKRLEAYKTGNESLITKAEDTKVVASFGKDKNGKEITEKSYLNQKEVPLNLSVDKDNDKILGYEIIREEAIYSEIDQYATTKNVVVGFVERDKENEITEYVDVIDAVNNKTFKYKVRAYDYNLNVTEEKEVGTVKVSHDGSIGKKNWIFDTNTRSADDSVTEDSGHGQVQNGAINNIKDNDPNTVYNASKATDKNGNEVVGNPYITIDLGNSKQVVGLKYTPGKTVEKKFSLKNFFKRNKEVSYEPISKYEVRVSKDGSVWKTAHKGTFDTTKENTIYFNEAGNSDNSQLWAYNAQYVQIIATGAKTISIGELDILGPQGDNIEIGVDKDNNQVYENGVGRLKSDYVYNLETGDKIPQGSIIVTGEYKGDPAFNAPLVLNENGGNFALEAQAILLATLPEDSPLGEVAEGNWIYWITPEQQEMIIGDESNIQGSAIKAELYRFNKVENNVPVGQRLVSDSFYINLPKDLKELPEIDLTGGQGRTLNNTNKVVMEINTEMMKNLMNNR